MREVSDRQTIVPNLEAFVHQLRRKGVMLWTEDTCLRYRAPKGVLTAEERQALSGANEKIATLLERHLRYPGLHSATGRSVGVRRAPLSLTQLEHWHDRLQYGGRPIRNIACAFRLRGALRVELLAQAVTAMGRRHDALRTRIVLCDDKYPVQEVADRYRSDLNVMSLTRLPEACIPTEIELGIRRAILDADDYTLSQLFEATLLTIDASDHVLIFAMDHMISDLASLHILSEEAFTAYAQFLAGETVELPSVSVQFPDHATRMCVQPNDTLARVARRFDSFARTRFPDDLPPGSADVRESVGLIRFEIDRGLCFELRSWARRRGTTIVIATLTAYASLVLRWCGVEETVILFMTDGRTSSELERAIGYLAFPLYVRVAIDKRSTFLELLRVTTEEYCRASDESDFGYARAQVPRPEFTRNTAVNWLPSGAAASGTLATGTDGALSWSPIEFANPVTQWDEEPGVSFSEGEGTILGQVSYRRDRFSSLSMTRFAGNIIEFLTAMLRTPTQRVMDVELK